MFCQLSEIRAIRPLEFSETVGALEHICGEIEVAWVHAQVTRLPHFALQTIDDGLTVLGMLLARAVKQERVPSIHPRRVVRRRASLCEFSELVAEFPAFVTGNKLAHANDDEANR